MSVADIGSTAGPLKNGGVKTIAIRLEPELHAELSLIAQLRDQTITDEIRQALESHVAAIKANPDLADKADDVLADIERQAAARRDAFARLFGTQPDSAADAVEAPATAVVAELNSRGSQPRGRKDPQS